MADTFTENMNEIGTNLGDTTNPATAAARGANPDQVKMMGTPANKVGQLGINSTGVRGNIHQPKAIQPPKVTEERRIQETKRYTDQVTEEQKLNAAKQIQADEALTRLDNTGSAIKNLLIGKTNALFDKAAAEKAAGQVELTIDQLPEATQDAVTKSINEWQSLSPDLAGNVVVNGVTRNADEYRNELIGNVIKAIGVPNAEGKVIIDPKLLVNLFPTAEDAVVNAFTTAMADHVTINDDMLKSMGYEDADLPVLKDQLGLTGTETISEYRDKVANYRDKVIKPIEDLRANLNDPDLTPSEREASREELRDMGYVGVLADTAKLDKLSSDINVMGKNIQIGDKIYTEADDFLSDENLAGLVSDYINGKLDADKLPSGMAELIDRNRDVFEEAIGELGAEVTKFTDTQNSWKPLTDSGLDASILKSLVPGYDPAAGFYTTNAPDLSNNSTFKYITSPTTTATQKATITGMINDIATGGLPPEGIKLIMEGLDDTELQALQDEGTRSQFVSGIKFGNKVKNLYGTVDSKTAEQTLAELVGLDNPNELADLVNDLNVMASFGDREAIKLLDTLNEVFDPTSGRKTLDKFAGLLDFGNLKGVNSVGQLADSIRLRIDTASSGSMGDMRTVADMAQGTSDLAYSDTPSAVKAFDLAFGVTNTESFVEAWKKVGGQGKAGLKPIWDTKVANVENIVNTQLTNLTDQNWESKAEPFANMVTDLLELSEIDPALADRELNKFVPAIMTPHPVSDQEMTDLINQAGVSMQELGLNPNIPITQQLRSKSINRVVLNDIYGPLVRINRMLKAAGKPPMGKDTYLSLRHIVKGGEVVERVHAGRTAKAEAERKQTFEERMAREEANVNRGANG